ncbi:MAG TPA: SDR family oxidoreductase [Acidimicrobiales bacterium]|nr:SDR family oxidoreductase [Acidimicrobiales bacterium]
MRVFVTGASGWIGSGLVPDLIAAGHEVVGLARSDDAAGAVAALGAKVHRGSLDDLDGLRTAAASADGVIHLAFRHDLAFTGDMAGAAAADRMAIEVLGDALEGSDRPLVIASGVFGIAPGQVATEQDATEDSGGTDVPIEGGHDRMANAHYTVSLASRGVRSSVLRLPPTCHGDGDNGFMAMLVGIARDKGVSGYVGDGSARWPATHRLDVARAFRLALEQAPGGSTLHGVAEQGVPGRAFAEVMGRKLDLPVVSVSPQDALGHFGFLGFLLPIDSVASSERTRAVLGWEPTHPGLLEDLGEDHYYSSKD